MIYNKFFFQQHSFVAVILPPRKKTVAVLSADSDEATSTAVSHTYFLGIVFNFAMNEDKMQEFDSVIVHLKYASQLSYSLKKIGGCLGSRRTSFRRI